MTARTPTPQGISYHYVITVQFEQQNGVQQVSYGHGIIVPGPGESRSDVFRHLFHQMADRGTNPVPLFFSLEPEDLTVTSPPSPITPVKTEED